MADDERYEAGTHPIGASRTEDSWAEKRRKQVEAVLQAAKTGTKLKAAVRGHGLHGTGGIGGTGARARQTGWHRGN